jgi:predicted kinase
MQKRAVEALNNGRDVIYDATNITRKDREGIIAVCPKFVKIECHIVWAPIETCLERDANRDRTVGKEVIDRMLKRFQAVYYDEGVDEIKVHSLFVCTYKYS